MRVLIVAKGCWIYVVLEGITGQSLSTTGRGVHSLDVGFNSLLTIEFVVTRLPFNGVIVRRRPSEKNIQWFSFRPCETTNCQSSRYLQQNLRKDHWKTEKIVETKELLKTRTK